MSELSIHRKFLHDIANPIAGLSLTIGFLIKTMGQEDSSLTSEQVLARLKKCHEMLKQLEELHADQKSKLTDLKL